MATERGEKRLSGTGDSGIEGRVSVENGGRKSRPNRVEVGNRRDGVPRRAALARNDVHGASHAGCRSACDGAIGTQLKLRPYDPVTSGRCGVMLRTGERGGVMDDRWWPRWDSSARCACSE